jgi:K+-transporting ATPase ATPase A chain
MTVNGWLQIVFYVAVLTALTPLLGHYMARVYTGERVFLTPLMAPVERLFYQAIGARSESGQDWRSYARSVLVFSALSWVLLYLILRTQSIQPFNPEGFGSAPWDVTFNTTSSFVSNTNWQFYGGETTMSYFSQMFGLAVQNFLSAAVGMAVLIAVIRGIISRGGHELGNFWVDLTRSLLYILLPLSILGALFLVSQGVVQTLGGYLDVSTLAGGRQGIAFGPAASQIAIKQLGTNGGGFFNVNSSMPFENPTALTNFVEVIFILLIPAALTATFGRMVGSARQGWAIFVTMSILLAVGLGVSYAGEQAGSPAQDAAGISATADGSDSSGGNLEGKEQRFGIASSTEWATVTTAASNGSVNSALDSYTGVGGAVPLVNMLTGEVIFGGVGSGLYGMLLFVLLGVFIAGLMVGRTPEYLGKKIEAKEIKLVMIGTLVVPLLVLVLTAVAISTKYGAASIYNSGPQGFSETLYAYGSQANNNGSAFAGFTGFVQPNAPGNVGSFGITFADLLGGFAMLIGRFVPLLAALAVAGSLAGKRIAPAGPGTLRTDNGTFVALLIFVIVVVAALTFFPALLLGPIGQGLTERLF